MSQRKGISRRDFVKSAGALPIATGLLAGLTRAAAGNGKSRVVIVRSPGVMPMGTNDPKTDVLKKMVDHAVARLAGSKSPAEAWGMVATPGDVVGIKVNCIAGRNISTHHEMARAIAEGLTEGGLPESSVVIWDRQDRELTRCRYEITTEPEGVRCYGTDNGAGGWSAQPVTVSGQEMKISSILDRQTTLLINAPIVKDHGICGVTGALKNHYGTISNPGALHGGHCDPHLANLNSLPAIKDKTRLILADALRCIYDGGPGFNEKHIWHEEAVIASKDPVALDRVIAELIEAQRAKNGHASLSQCGRPWSYIQTAGAAGLGRASLSDIDVIEETV